MSKKQRILPIAEPLQLTPENIQSGNLPAVEAVNQTVAQVTGKPAPPPPYSATDSTPLSIAAENEGILYFAVPPSDMELIRKQEEWQRQQKELEKQRSLPPVEHRQIGRPKKAIADGRIKYNTMLKPEFIRRLRIKAAEGDMTPADLLEVILQNTPHLK